MSAGEARLLQVSSFVKCGWTLLRLNSLEPYPSSERKGKFRCRLCTSSVKRKIRHFHVVVTSAVTAKKCTIKRDVPAKLLFWLLNLLLFWRFRSRRCRRSLFCDGRGPRGTMRAEVSPRDGDKEKHLRLQCLQGMKLAFSFSLGQLMLTFTSVISEVSLVHQDKSSDYAILENEWGTIRYRKGGSAYKRSFITANYTLYLW